MVILGISNVAPRIYGRLMAVISIHSGQKICRSDRAATAVMLQNCVTRPDNNCYLGTARVFISNDNPLTYRRHVAVTGIRVRQKTLSALPPFSEPPHFVPPKAGLRKMDTTT